jgi:hypothetical protein
MAYYLDLFSPETYDRFSRSDRSVSGFRERHRNAASRVKPGDILVCYMTRVSRWFGLLQVDSSSFEDPTALFAADNDPFLVRFHVTPLVWLLPEQALPIHDEALWRRLSMTRQYSGTSPHWTGFFRTSLNRLSDEDGQLLESLLRQQAIQPKQFPLTDRDRKALAPSVVRRPNGPVAVVVPDEDDSTVAEAPAHEARESTKVQALLAQIGAAMGFRIWLPAGDRSAVLKEWKGEQKALVGELPLNYDEVTLGTIERIDVLWLKGRSIVRAFEVEHTTAIYSGLLRMADLLSLQPNMDIKLHIVAPDARRAKVLEEIRRPVFSLLERRPLHESCTFLSYDSIRTIAALPHLAHTTDSILEEYVEEAD